MDEIARIQAEAAIEGYRSIFPPSAPKPTADALSPGWRDRVEDEAVDVLVAVRPRPVGAVVVRPSDGSRSLLERLYVDPGWWGRGIGALLHDAAMEAARARGASAVELWVLEANVRARSMYERRGWVLDPDRLSHPEGVAEVLYHRDLTG